MVDGSVSVTEKDFLAGVLELATLAGWLVYHTYDSRRSQAGFPDIALVKNQRMIFVELKTNTGRVRAAQQTWLDALGQIPCVDVYLWRPRDWDEIEAILTRV